MGIRNRSKESRNRLAAKSLDTRFRHETQQGLNCSPFEAEAVLQVVKEVYFAFLNAELSMGPPASPSQSVRRRRFASRCTAVARTLGCGDVFHGAYAAALSQGEDLPRRVALAAAAAALKATRRGGQAGIPYRRTVEPFLA